MKCLFLFLKKPHGRLLLTMALAVRYVHETHSVTLKKRREQACVAMVSRLATQLKAVGRGYNNMKSRSLEDQFT